MSLLSSSPSLWDLVDEEEKRSCNRVTADVIPDLSTVHRWLRSQGLLTPGLDNTRLYMSLTAGARIRFPILSLDSQSTVNPWPMIVRKGTGTRVIDRGVVGRSSFSWLRPAVKDGSRVRRWTDNRPSDAS